MTKKLTIEDLVQFDRDRMARLTKDALLDLSLRLRDFGIELYEKPDEDSSNSSKPPSGDGPFKRGKRQKSEEDPEENSRESGEEAVEPVSGECAVEDGANADETERRKPGKQIGAEGFGRVEKGPPERTEDHWPETCSLCSSDLAKPPYLSAYTGHHTYELEKDVEPNQIRIVRTLHRYHTVVCRCGHENKAAPGQGAVSVVEGRKRDLKLAENRLVGPMLATFIAALNRDCKMSREKTRQYLAEWFGFEVSVGTVCNCIREAGVACYPVVESLVEELQREEKVHLEKLKSLANEILNDWDAVVAFVKNPDLPPTNNEAERALRMAVIYRKICFGSRTDEGSRSFAAFISVMETCKRRGADPWEYIASVIACGRKGIAPPPIPAA